MSNFEVLKKYSSRTLDVIKPSPLGGILQKLSKNSRSKGGPALISGVFLTGDNFENPYVAREYLALTYPPVRCYSILGINRFPGFRSPKYGSLNTFSRVWPAFGHPGGGSEILLTEGQLRCIRPKPLRNDNRYQDDEFIMDSTELEPAVKAYFIILGFDWFKSAYSFRIDELYFTLKIIESDDPLAGFVLNFQEDFRYRCPKEYEDKLNITISCAYNIKKFEKYDTKPSSYGPPAETDKLELKFWGYVWLDCEKRGKRYLSTPTIRLILIDDLAGLTANIGKDKTLSELLSGPNYSQIKNCLEQMRSALTQVAGNFRQNIEKDIDLPPLPKPLEIKE